MCSAVTDRPLTSNKEQHENSLDKIFQTASISTPTSIVGPNSGTLILDAQNQTKEKKFFSPEHIHSYPAALFHDKTSKKKSKKDKTVIATDAPEKIE